MSERFRWPNGPLEPMVPDREWPCGCSDRGDSLAPGGSSHWHCNLPTCVRDKEKESCDLGADTEEGREYYRIAAENMIAAFHCRDGQHAFLTAYDAAGNWHSRCQCGEQEQSGGPTAGQEEGS